MAGKRSSSSTSSLGSHRLPPTVEMTNLSSPPERQRTKPAATSSATSALSSARRKKKKEQKEFNPTLIFSQIVSLQCFHYLILSILFQCNYILYGTSITIDRIFTDRYLRLWHSHGWPDLISILLSSVAGALLLAVIVEKSKKCLDFAVTLFLLHFIICTTYNGIPATWDWWIVHILGTIIMVVLGEYICSLKELDEIPLLQL